MVEAATARSSEPRTVWQVFVNLTDEYAKSVSATKIVCGAHSLLKHGKVIALLISYNLHLQRHASALLYSFSLVFQVAAADKIEVSVTLVSPRSVGPI